MNPLLVVVALGIVAIAWSAHESEKQFNPDPGRGQIEVYATSLMVYHQAVYDYARANPAFIGTVSEGSLNLPTWYTNLGWTNQIAADGTVRAYLIDSAPVFAEARQITGEVVTRMNGYSMVGTTVSGGYQSPVHGFVAQPTVTAGLPLGVPFIASKPR